MSALQWLDRNRDYILAALGVCVLVSAFLLSGYVAWLHARPQRASWANTYTSSTNYEVITGEMIASQERELKALRETVALYKAEDEKRRTKTWEGDNGLWASMSVNDGAVQYVINGKSVDRDTFYRWLDDYMLKRFTVGSR